MSLELSFFLCVCGWVGVSFCVCVYVLCGTHSHINDSKSWKPFLVGFSSEGGGWVEVEVLPYICQVVVYLLDNGCWSHWIARRQLVNVKQERE